MTTSLQDNIPQSSYYEKPYSLIRADVMEWAETYKGEPFHAMLTDPPYHLTSIQKRFSKPDSKAARVGVYNRASKGFLGTDWDGGDVAFRPETWEALMQHLYPGAFIMAYAGTRGYHRMACAMEDAGLIIHPALGFLFGTGFCKATRIDTQIDKVLGAKPKVVGRRKRDAGSKSTHAFEKSRALEFDITKPSTPQPAVWTGHRYGLQALKPAFEFIAVAQVPYTGRPIDCITQTGAGALNIDAGRIPGPGWKWGTQTDIRGNGYGSNRPSKGDILASDVEGDPRGRWPANLLLQHSVYCNGECTPDCPVRMMDEQSGNRPAGSSKTGNEPSEPTKNVYSKRNPVPFTGYGDDGGASRFFFQADWSYEILEQIEAAAPAYYTSKPGVAEKEAGLDDLPTQTRNRVNSGGLENEPRFAPVQAKNNHPTVKSISLNKYLASLLLPPEAYGPRRILVPFMGSGSEACGSVLAGWEKVVGIEKYPVPDKPISKENPDYIGIAEARLAWWSEWLKYGKPEVEVILAAEEVNEQQLRMFE